LFYESTALKRRNKLFVTRSQGIENTFSLRPLVFDFVARQSVSFPPGKAANIIRGALGSHLKRSSCIPECLDARACELRGDCTYARLFEPTSSGQGPSGFADPPRPFVLRTSHLDGQKFAPGEFFRIGINLFDLHPHAPLHLIRALSRLVDSGLGPGRGAVSLQSVSILDSAGHEGQRIFNHDRLLPLTSLESVNLPLAPPIDAPASVRVDFLTPTDLKGKDYIPGNIPSFATLFARIRDRVANLHRIYSDAALDIDYSGLSAQAATVSLITGAIRKISTDRYSIRKDQSHTLGGLVGHCIYAGRLHPFLPYLAAARWTGVGKHNVWGNGEIAITHL
jgi:hypothetical protein